MSEADKNVILLTHSAIKNWLSASSTCCMAKFTQMNPRIIIQIIFKVIHQQLPQQGQSHHVSLSVPLKLSEHTYIESIGGRDAEKAQI